MSYIIEHVLLGALTISGTIIDHLNSILYNQSEIIVSILTKRFVIGSDQLHRLTQKIGSLAIKRFATMR